MQLRFYINSTLVTEPKDSNSMVTSITKARDIKALLVKQDVSVTFTGDGYDLLRSLYTQYSFTGEAELLITYSVDEGANWRPYYKGLIFLADIEWDRKRDYAKVTIKDNSFYSRINNNKSLKVYPAAGKTKNGVSISAANIFFSTWFNPANGNLIINDVGKWAHLYGYKIYDLLSYMVKYMSDDEMGFDSDYFNTGSKFEWLCLTNGKAFRTSVESALVGSGGLGGTIDTAYFKKNWTGITFEELLKTIGKLAPLYFIIDYSLSKPTLRIENQPYFDDAAVLVELDNIDEHIEKTDFTQLYSKIKFGSGQVSSKIVGWTSFSEGSKFVGFNQEEFVILGTSNLDTTLDLQLDSNFITSSNMIEDIYDNRITSFDDGLDDDFFFYITIDAYNGDPANFPFDCKKDNWISPTSVVRYYNEQLTNANIAQRFLGAVPNSIANTITPAVSSNFKAFTTATVSHLLVSGNPTYEPFVFDNDSTAGGFDTSANYDAVTNHRFTAPSDGVYSFAVNAGFTAKNESGAACPVNAVTFTLTLERYDSGSTLLDTIQIASNIIAPLNNPTFGGTMGSTALSGSANLTLYTGEYVDVKLTVAELCAGSDTYYDILSGANFACTASPEGGGNYQTYKPSDYAVIRHEFKYPLTDDQRKTILTNPKGLIKFRRDGEQWTFGRIESIKIPVRGDAQFVLSSKMKVS